MDDVFNISLFKSENIIAIGAIFIPIFIGLWAYIFNAVWGSISKWRASRQVYDILWDLFAELEQLGSRDFSSKPGFWYRLEIAEMLSVLTKNHYRTLGGKATYRVIRLVGGLKNFSIDHGKTDSSVYSMDELIKDANAVMNVLLPKAFLSPWVRSREETRLEEQRSLMENGLGGFRKVS